MRIISSDIYISKQVRHVKAFFHNTQFLIQRKKLNMFLIVIRYCTYVVTSDFLGYNHKNDFLL